MANSHYGYRITIVFGYSLHLEFFPKAYYGSIWMEQCAGNVDIQHCHLLPGIVGCSRWYDFTQIWTQKNWLPPERCYTV